MEVDGEGPDQVNGSVTVETGQQISEFGGDSGRGAGLAESLGEVPHLFDRVEEVLAVLADKGVAQLVTQSPDVGAQCCVSGLGSGWDGVLGKRGVCHGRDSTGIPLPIQEKIGPAPELVWYGKKHRFVDFSSIVTEAKASVQPKWHKPFLIRLISNRTHCGIELAVSFPSQK